MEDDTQTSQSVSADDPLINVSIESWRFARVYSRAVLKLDATEQTKYTSQLRYFLKQIEDNLKLVNVTLVNLEGHPFDPGLPISAINVSDFTDGGHLIIDQMLEPVVMGPTGLIKMGKVLLKKVEQ